MAQIILRGREPVYIEDKKARVIESEWLKGMISERLKIANESIEARDIKGFRFEQSPDSFNFSSSKKYNLDDQNDRRIILDFEKDFLEFLKKQKNKKPIDVQINYLASLGAVRIIRRKPIPDYSVRDPHLYRELNSKFSALNDLYVIREKARKMNNEGIDESVQRLTSKMAF